VGSKFSDNKALDEIFSFDEIDTSWFFVNDSIFEGNTYARLTRVCTQITD